MIGLQGEHRVLEAFRQDPFGCGGSLMSKKHDRDPFAVGPYSSNRCVGLEPMLNYCQDTVNARKGFSDIVPWGLTH